MFHRVKSETQPDQDQARAYAAPVAVKENETAAASESKPAELQKSPEKTSESAKPSGSFHARTAETAKASQPVYKSQSYLQISNTKEDKKTMPDQNATSPADKEQNTYSSSNESSASLYQQRSSASSASSSGYNPSVYSSPYAQKSSSPAASAPASSADTANDRRLTIGRGITMSGEIESCDHLYVEGTVEAALKGANVLDIAESGIFYGTVEINEANISGRFEGELTVKGRLTIESTGVITGSISYGELQVENGAVIDGRMTPIAAAKSPAKASAASSSSSARSASSSRSEGALFEERGAFEAAE